MSYLVLARKWRPRRFAELVGQEHVVRALTNALTTGRVHHAFLFTGTRGVGKTTIARIFAKSLNCERGEGAEPCGECRTCVDIDAGRFVDLLEIDAASNTGVDDVREVIENAQYKPSRGRTKVYLVDEVHMLSKPAFNALLKTLEEPPAHVKFLLATTDPQKLPVTVLSRCLQFNLKRLDESQIRGQMEKILAAEGLAAEAGAVALLARGADGSLRDGLSLLDQAIAYTAGVLDEAGVRVMLGTVDSSRVGSLLEALVAADGAALMARIDALAGFSPDFAQVLDAVAASLHRIQLQQLVPGVAEGETDEVDTVGLATQLAPEIVQLWYQMAICGRRDLPLAPSPRSGFEMSLLRMLAFRPAGADAVEAATGAPVRKSAPKPAQPTSATPFGRAQDVDAVFAQPSRTGTSIREPSVPAKAGTNEAPSTPVSKGAIPAGTNAAGPLPASPMSTAPTQTSRTPSSPNPARPASTRPVTAGPVPAGPVPAGPVPAGPVPAGPVPAGSVPSGPVSTGHVPARPVNTTTRILRDADDWMALVAECELKGPARDLAANASFVGHAGGALTLALPDGFEHLRGEVLVGKLADAFAGPLGGAPKIVFATAGEDGDTLHARNARARDERQAKAERDFTDNPTVRRYMQQFGAKLVPDSIRPTEPE